MAQRDLHISSKNRELIQTAIRKIAAGRGYDRLKMAKYGTDSVGSARMIHGYVAKIHDNPDDSEYEYYAGTIDVREFPDETANAEPFLYKGVMLCGVKNNTNGMLVIPTLYSDVTVIMDSGTEYMYVVNYSHADIIQLDPHEEMSIGSSETEELDLEDNDSPDYDELEKTGRYTKTTYTPLEIITIVEDKRKELVAKYIMNTDGMESEVGDSKINQSKDSIKYSVNDTSVIVEDGKIYIGGADAVEPLVLGNELATLMQDFLTECSKITTTTMLGTMPAMNFANFTALMSKIERFKSKTAFTK